MIITGKKVCGSCGKEFDVKESLTRILLREVLWSIENKCGPSFGDEQETVEHFKGQLIRMGIKWPHMEQMIKSVRYSYPFCCSACTTWIERERNPNYRMPKRNRQSNQGLDKNSGATVNP